MSKQKETIQVFSGGSCGEPKQVSRSRQSWLCSLEVETQAFDLRLDHRYAVLGSPQHSLWAYAMFRAEQTRVFCKGLPGLPRDQLTSIDSQAVSVLYAVTPLLHLLCRHAVSRRTQLNCVEKIIVGGAAWPERLTALCQQTFPRAEIICFYGSVELGYVAHSRPSEPLRPFPRVQIRIDPFDPLEQLWVRSPLTIRPDHWLASGDRVAWVDSGAANESRPGFSILGRVDRVINQSGVKIQPEPIEEAMRMRLDSAELALIGLPDHLRGERMALLLGPELQARHIEIKQVLHDLAGSMVPSLQGVRLHQLTVWPTRSNGKLNLKALLNEIPGSYPVLRGGQESQ